MSDFKTNKVTHTTALLGAADTEVEVEKGGGGVTRGDENSRTLSNYTETTESDRIQHLCYF